MSTATLSERLIRERLEQVNKALADNEQERRVLLQIRDADLNLLRQLGVVRSAPAGASPGQPPLIESPTNGARVTSWPQAIVHLLRAANGVVKSTDEILQECYDLGLQTEARDPRRQLDWIILKMIRDDPNSGIEKVSPHRYRWRGV